MGEKSLSPDDLEAEHLRRIAYRYTTLVRPECQDGFRELDSCKYMPTDPSTADPAAPVEEHAPPSHQEVETLVRRLASRLALPAPTPHIGPDPSANEWNRSFVGLPLWLWTAGDPTLHSTVTGYGITITMDAQRGPTTFTMGDGTTVRCLRMTPYTTNIKAGAASPTCGHTYTWPSLPHSTYTITATNHWNVTWTALGYTGTIPLTRTAQRELPVGELHSLTAKR